MSRVFPSRAVLPTGHAARCDQRAASSVYEKLSQSATGLRAGRDRLSLRVRAASISEPLRACRKDGPLPCRSSCREAVVGRGRDQPKK